jgi:hypothetical protein
MRQGGGAATVQITTRVCRNVVGSPRRTMEEGRSGPEMVRIRSFGGGVGAGEGASLEMVAGRRSRWRIEAGEARQRWC